MLRVFVAFVLTLSALLTWQVPRDHVRAQPQATTKPKTVRLLTVGNSFSGNATYYLGDLAKAAGHTLIHRPLVMGGASFADHWKKVEDHARDPKTGLYGKRNLREELQAEPWDFVTLQQASIHSHNAATHQPYAGQLHALVKKLAPKAEIVIHQTWAYRVDSPRFAKKDPPQGEPKTRQEMHDGLTRAYDALAAELGLRVIPVGDAFHLADTDAKWGYKPDKKFDFAAAQQPALPDQTHSLHTGWRWGKSPDGKDRLTLDANHANMAGQYLAACVWFEFLFGDSCVGNRFVPEKMEADYARFLQETAHKAVAARQTKRNARSAANAIWAEIQVHDSATGRGIPLVELETVNSLKFVTDNAGRVAFHEPGLMERELFFHVRSHGYETQKDGFGIKGVRVTPRVGQQAIIKLKRQNVAERLCRLTGEGLYRDSVLLGYTVPLPDPLNPGRVGGQDSIQAAVYRDRVYWFWGDTLRMNYPLGLFRMAGATTPVPDPKAAESDPAGGIPFQYFVDKTGFARAMMPLPERPEGVVWVGAVFTVPDEHEIEKLVGHYSRRKGLVGEFEQGIAVFNPEKDVFESAKQLPLHETWRHPKGHPIVYEDGGTKWLLFGSPTPNVRVPATLKDVLDPTRYEAFTCAQASEPNVDPDGKPIWRWQKELPPVDSKREQQWLKDGKLKPDHARFCPADAATPTERVVLHSGSVRWNPHRQRWLLVAGQIGGKPSLLGEVWYAEAEHATGPFPKAVKVVTHDRQTFYNVCHHSFLDRDGGRTIHFEGTYTNDFSGNPDRTPRYNYNQVLYRLDLDAPALQAARTTR